MKKFQTTPEDFRIFAKDGCYYFIAISLMSFLYVMYNESFNFMVFIASFIFSIPLIIFYEFSKPEKIHVFILLQMVSMILAIIIYVNSPIIGSPILNKINALSIIFLFFGLYGFYLKKIKK